MKLFDHEKLDVYKVSMGFITMASDIIEQLPQGKRPLADQLQRAATSISLNIAEGAGEFSAKEKARFYRMAKRSATECAAIIDICLKMKHVEAQQYQASKSILLRIVSMLTKLAQKGV